MQKFYFTFGSDPQFPYGRDDYVMVKAESGLQACNLFRAVHPNRKGSNFLNCSEVYTEEQFEPIWIKYYPGRPPIESITVTRAKIRSGRDEN